MGLSGVRLFPALVVLCAPVSAAVGFPQPPCPATEIGAAPCRFFALWGPNADSHWHSAGHRNLPAMVSMASSFPLQCWHLLLALYLSGLNLTLESPPHCSLQVLDGAHSLHYNLTVRCQGGFVLSRFFAQGCLDDQPFLSYDSERGSVVPCALWAETVLGPETWDTETQDLAESGKNLKGTLADINFLKEEKGGSHSLQENWGCEIREDNHTRGFWNFYYDGEPFLSYHPETRSWTVLPSSAQILAMKVKNSWDAYGIQSKAQWAHVQGTVCGRLWRYLNSWIAFNETTVSPTVNVTCDEVLEDTIFVTCWAWGFYPQNISLTWLQDGEPLSQETQQSGSILSYGNGTYQTWMSTRIPQGQEQRFSCHVLSLHVPGSAAEGTN
ncbi:MHC class I polypeptide-related sequence B-like [Urocitellus parryii]